MIFLLIRTLQVIGILSWLRSALRSAQLESELQRLKGSWRPPVKKRGWWQDVEKARDKLEPKATKGVGI